MHARTLTISLSGTKLSKDSMNIRNVVYDIEQQRNRKWRHTDFTFLLHAMRFLGYEW